MHQFPWTIQYCWNTLPCCSLPFRPHLTVMQCLFYLARCLCPLVLTFFCVMIVHFWWKTTTVLVRDFQNTNHSHALCFSRILSVIICISPHSELRFFLAIGINLMLESVKNLFNLVKDFNILNLLKLGNSDIRYVCSGNLVKYLIVI